MADQKISELVQINIGDLADADEFVIADASASDNKSITWGEMTQSDPTDDTAGRLLTTGSFAYAKEIETNASHVDDLTELGKYNFSSGGRPDGLPEGTGGTIEVFYDRFGFFRQHFYPRDSPNTYVRTRDGDGVTWSDWQEVWHTGNLEKQSDPMDDTSGRVALVGMAGLLGEAEGIDDWDTLDKNQGTNLKYSTKSNTANSPWDAFTSILALKRDNDRVGFLGVRASGFVSAQIGFWDGTDTEVEDIWHTGNTTVDGSGFILEASPIVRVYTDSISEPVKPVGATLTHSETGVYVLSGVPPLATEGWTVRTPEDHNGNKIIAIDPPEYDAETETLTLRTYDLLWREGRLVPGDRMDVPGDYFVMLRFHEEPEEE